MARITNFVRSTAVSPRGYHATLDGLAWQGDGSVALSFQTEDGFAITLTLDADPKAAWACRSRGQIHLSRRNFDKAILEHQFLLRHEKQRIVSYRSLKHLYIQTGQRDKAAHLSYALTFLKKSEPDDAKRMWSMWPRLSQLER